MSPEVCISIVTDAVNEEALLTGDLVLEESPFAHAFLMGFEVDKLYMSLIRSADGRDVEEGLAGRDWAIRIWGCWEAQLELWSKKMPGPFNMRQGICPGSRGQECNTEKSGTLHDGGEDQKLQCVVLKYVCQEEAMNCGRSTKAVA